MAFAIVSKEKPEFPDGVPVIWVKGEKDKVEMKALSSAIANSFSTNHRKNMHRSMCAAAGTGYGATSGEYDGSYSASRQEVITAAQRDLARQMLVIDSLITPIYEEFVMQCIARGLISYHEGNVFNARYVAPKREHIDPLKQAKSVALKLATNQTSLSDILATEGKDFDTFIIHLKDELTKLKEAGLQPNGVEAIKYLELHFPDESENDENKPGGNQDNKDDTTLAA